VQTPFQRQQKQQHAAENAKRLQADAHEVEERRAAEGEQEQDQGGHDDRLQRHAPLVVGGGPLRQPREQRDQRHRLHHHEEHDQEFQRLLEHGAVRKALPNLRRCRDRECSPTAAGQIIP
jgi:hypothetical protein